MILRRIRNILLGLLFWMAVFLVTFLLAKWTGHLWFMLVFVIAFGGAALVGRILIINRRGW